MSFCFRAHSCATSWTFVFPCRRLIPQHDWETLLEVLDFLNQRVYCRLDASYEPVIRKLEVSTQGVVGPPRHQAGSTTGLPCLQFCAACHAACLPVLSQQNAASGFATASLPNRLVGFRMPKLGD